MSSGRLESSETWTSDTDLALTEAERAFLAASRSAEDARTVRSRRIRTRVMATFALIAVIATVLAVVALVQRSRAIESEQLAQDKVIEAEENAQEAARQQELAEASELEAEQQREEALRAAALARSRELAASAIATLDEDPQLSMLLAIESATTADPPAAAVETLHRAVQTQRTVFVHEFDGGAAEWALSPDGALLAITTDGATVQIVESRTGEPVTGFSIPSDTLLGDGTSYPNAEVRNRLREDGYPVGEPMTCSNVWAQGGTSALAFSPDGSVLTAALADGRVHLFDFAAGQELPSPVPPVLTDFGPYCFNYIAVGFTPTGDGIVVAPQVLGTSFMDWTEDVTIWPLSGAPPIEAAQGIPTGITARLDPSGERLAAADFWGFTTRIIDVGGTEPELVLESGREQFDAIFTPDGSHVITAGRERLAKMWNLSTGELVETFEGAESALSISDGGLLATAAFDGQIRIWDLDSRRLVTTLRGHQGVVTDVQITQDGSTVVSGGYEDGTIRVWDLSGATEAEVGGTELDVFRVTGLDLDENHAVVLTRPQAVEPGITHVLDLETLEPVTEIAGQFGYGVRLLPDGSGFAAEDVGDEFFGPIRVRDLRTGETVGVALEINECDEVPTEGGTDTELICPPYPEPGHYLFPIEIDISPDGRYLAAGGLADAPDPHHAAVFDLRTGELLQTWAYSSLYHHGVKFTPDGHHLAVGSNGDVRLYEVGTWTESVLIPFDGDAKHIAFTPDGALIAIGGEATNLVVVADAATGEQAYEITDHQGDVTDLEFSDDGSLLLTASTDGTIRLWDAGKGTSVLTVPLETSGSVYAKFDPRDPDHIVFAREDGLVGVLTTDTEELLAIARGRVLRDFTAAECERFGAVCSQG
jgi:WD40 repeat protein